MPFSTALSFGASLFLSLCAINYSIMHNIENFLIAAILAMVNLIIGLMSINKEI